MAREMTKVHEEVSVYVLSLLFPGSFHYFMIMFVIFRS